MNPLREVLAVFKRVCSTFTGATGLLTTFMGLPDTPENRAKFLATIPMGRMSTPRDVPMPASISHRTRPISSPARFWRSMVGRTI